VNWNPEDYARNSSAQLGWARELISRLALGGSEAVLDVGCGDGKITAAFAGALPSGYVLGVDSSPEFIAYASLHHPPEGLAGWIRTTWMPYTLRLPDELRESFVAELVSRYLHDTPPDSFGRTHVRMVRLEIEATQTP
jgi:trans-aconitate methyltransferase